MPTKPLDRLMFAQGGLCFFCSAPLPKSEASVEHLVASSRAGSNSDDNCVACCKAMNGLLGSMSLKEKIKVVLKKEVAVARDLPNVDISDSKRNRFVIVGRVVSAMKLSGIKDEEIMDARQNMLQKETGFVQFVENVSKYANLYDIN